MFQPSPDPRIFGLSPGIDFPQALVDGIYDRLDGTPPEAIAQVELFVNTRRMARRVQALFQSRGAGFLPKIRLITDIAHDPSFADLPQPINPLGRRLELAQLVKQLILAEPDIAAHGAAFDLADSLAALMEEMHGEGVSPDVLTRLDVGNHSAYWARSLKFLTLVQKFFSDDSILDAEARQRLIVTRLVEQWQTAPPDHPVIIAGSTGSRGTTALFMQAVAQLPQGAIILPGFDFNLTPDIWDQLDDKDAVTGEDHPQCRFHRLMQALSLRPDQIKRWTDAQPVSADRNHLISLALRPAPVTDAWLADGPNLTGLPQATESITMLETTSPREEAVAIALRLRKAVEDGTPAALITPDRRLTRQVTAALQRWGIEPDDSAGIPLSQTAPGRLIRQTAQLMGKRLTPELLVALLKHPLVGASERGEHLRRTRDLELEYLRKGAPFPTRGDLTEWMGKHPNDEGLHGWVTWLWDCLEALSAAKPQSLEAQLDDHIRLTEALAAGPGAGGTGGLWNHISGETAQATIEALRMVATHGGEMHPSEYADLIHAVLQKEEVRDPIAPHPGVMIWGTLEARVQGADLVIMAGLNDGIWPELPNPDAWLNRDMRKQAGLLLPDRRIGLSAHDFQQAIAAPQVWLTRSIRDAEAETVPSRWINRLCNLMNGLPQGGPEILEQMRARGRNWTAMARTLEQPEKDIPRAARPSPQPPISARPRDLSVTRIETLIRDPYSIYARYILGLKPLDPLHASPDAPLRGQALHEVLQNFVDTTRDGLPAEPVGHLMMLAGQIFDAQVPWPATRAMWLAKLRRAADWFIATEHERRQIARPLLTEAQGSAKITAPDFMLTGRADRIDLKPDGSLIIYDYKTGSLPTENQQKYFNKQLPLLAAIAERAGFAKHGPAKISETRYIGLGAQNRELASTYESADLDQIWADFIKLIAQYADARRGYSARRAVFETKWDQDYDHLARFGEWDQTDPVIPEKVGNDG